jgi:hypothetical protein
MSWLFDGRKRRREGGDGLEAAAELRQIDSEEMKSHATPDSCWVSIDGLVYDVTNFHRRFVPALPLWRLARHTRHATLP